MAKARFHEYRVVISQDDETGNIVAEVPTLGIADYGSSLQEALRNIQDMVGFHLECLVAEGETIPKEAAGAEGFYVRVNPPARAA